MVKREESLVKKRNKVSSGKFMERDERNSEKNALGEEG